MRFSLRSIFVTILLAGAAFGALLTRSALGTSGIVSLALLVYAVAFLGALMNKRAERARLWAFVGVGGVYLLLAVCASARCYENLITNYAIAWLARSMEVPGAVMHPGGGVFSVPAELVIPALPVQQFGGGVWATHLTLEEIIGLATADAPYSKELQRFFLTAHCAISWVLGFAGSIGVKLGQRSRSKI